MAFPEVHQGVNKLPAPIKPAQKETETHAGSVQRPCSSEEVAAWDNTRQVATRRQSAGLDPTVWYCRLDGFLSSGSMPKPVLDVSIWYRSMQQI